MKKLFTICRTRFHVPHPVVQRLLLWGFRLIALTLVAFAYYVSDRPALPAVRIGEMLRCILNGIWILTAGCVFLDRELSRNEDT